MKKLIGFVLALLVALNIFLLWPKSGASAFTTNAATLKAPGFELSEAKPALLPALLHF